MLSSHSLCSFSTRATATMAFTGDEIYDSDSSSDLGDTLGIETLAARSMVPDNFRQQPNAESSQSWMSINGRQFLKVDHAANIRMGTQVSKV